MIKLMFTGWRLLMTFVVLIVAGLLASLGVWQLNRMNERQALNDHITAQMTGAPMWLSTTTVNSDTLDYRRVLVRGTFDYSQEFLLRNRSFNEITGYHVITPLKMSDGQGAVLIDRGWVSVTQSSPKDRKAMQVPGDVTIDGVARKSQDEIGSPIDPAFTPERPRIDAWFRINIPRIEQQVGYPLLPVFVDQQPEAGTRADVMPTTFPVPMQTSDLGPGPHLNYALQWFSFAIILLVGYGAVNYQQVQKQRQEAENKSEEGEMRSQEPGVRSQESGVGS